MKVTKLPLKKLNYCLLCFLVFFPFVSSASVVDYGLNEPIYHPIKSKKAMVASVDSLATKVGVNILKQGGNAVDAAAAVAFALAVTHPQAGNLGGGGFMVLRLANGKSTTIDFREMAPAKAQKDMFLNDEGEVDRKRALLSHLAVGVPGTVAGFNLALQKYGSMPLSKVISPAINLAKNGFIVNQELSSDIETYGRKAMAKHKASQAIFFHKDGSAYQPGERLVQTNLAQSLELIAKDGPDAFYKGKIARQITAEMKHHNGFISMQDLANYKAIERKPVTGTYKGYKIISMPPPSSGGVHIVQILNILENFDLQKSGPNSARTIHLMAEAMKYAYADRSKYLGDPDFNKVPIKELTSKSYAKHLAEKINTHRTTPSSEIKAGNLAPYESDQTTHFSIVDPEGNAVAVTYTLNTTFGTGITATGSGILLNNEMDDFSAKPGSPNIFGLIGGKANAIAAGKRPLSSMSPTIVSKDGKTFLVTGSPGGSHIITTVLQIILNSIEFNMNIAEATNAPRIHHQWLPDELRIETGISPDTIRLLQKKGHKVVIKPTMGSAQSIMITKDGLNGSSDPRTPGDLTLGF